MFLGGIVDIIVYEKVNDGKLWELYYVIGGVCGGIVVDVVFESCFIDIFGEKVMNIFCKKKIMIYLEIFCVFEFVKRKLNLESIGFF